ncbi:MAG: hypothetical protein P1U32_08785 [Legionellaceae bacterium]|nr:hypothetical protein [Legionellaceae bacterium]
MSQPVIQVIVKFVLVLAALSGGFYIMTNKIFIDPLITFVCTGNTGRSPMAEYLSEHAQFLSKAGHRVNSRGVSVRPKETGPEANAVIVMKDMNIDMSPHRAKQLTLLDINKAHYILTMTKAQKDQILTKIAPQARNVYMLSECADGTQTDIPDAYNQDLAFYRDTRDKINLYIQEIIAQGGRCYFGR